MGTDHTEAVRVVREAIHAADAGIDQTSYEELARAAVEALYAATETADCPTCWGGALSGCPDCGLGSGKLPSRFLVVADAERDGKLERLTTWREFDVFREVPPEEGAR